MIDLKTVLANNREAVADFLTTAGAIAPSDWGRPRAPGKWSPGQVTEHVALTYEVSRGILHGTFPGPTAPRIARPLIRILFLNPVLKRGRFNRPAKTPKPFQPGASPALPEALTARLRAAATAFEEDVETTAGSGQATLDHPFFGKLQLAEYLRLQVIHTHHHRQQLTTTAD